jgi:asparagine synthase (glutamine-hydrolysing)
MCGICGVIGLESREAGESAVRRMMAAMIHRGPDEEGILLAPPVALGMRRLSIVDLAGGSQPVWNEAGTLAIVYNGEVYNFQDLRAELESLGHNFRSRSDTEVVVHAYQEWGERCAERLHGMFAFAIVEMPQGRAGRPARVFLARDRMGIKPLYYSRVGSNLFFASEVRALLASGCVPARISAAAIPSYLLFGSVCEPLTLIEGVTSLPPGYSLTVDATVPVSAVQPERYWDAPRAAPEPRSSPAKNVRALLEDAIARHLVADVPVGVFLSSGLDSTAIAAIASRARAGIHTFTVAFTDAEFSEAEIARRTANRLGTEHSELTLSGDEMLARLDEAIAAFDQPSMDGVNTYFVSWAARQAGLKVALSGLGSDEIFGGYSTFRSSANIARAAEAARILPRPLRSSVAAMLGRAHIFGGSPDAARKVSAAFLDPDSLPHAYFFTRLLFTPRVVVSTLHEPASSWSAASWMQWLADASRRAASMDAFTGISWLELRSYMLNTLLRDTDSMSMCHSLEVRVPFLDAPLVDYVLSLSASQKTPSPRPKALLVEALGELLPEEIITQRKRTFTFPWENWFRGSLGKRVAAGLSDWSPALASHLGADFARAVWKDYLAGRTTWSRPWSLYVLNEWAKRNVDEVGAGNSDQHKSPAIALS